MQTNLFFHQSNFPANIEIILPIYALTSKASRAYFFIHLLSRSSSSAVLKLMLQIILSNSRSRDHHQSRQRNRLQIRSIVYAREISYGRRKNYTARILSSPLNGKIKYLSVFFTQKEKIIFFFTRLTVLTKVRALTIELQFQFFVINYYNYFGNASTSYYRILGINFGISFILKSHENQRGLF